MYVQINTMCFVRTFPWLAILMTVKRFGGWALPNKKRCPDRRHACENSNRAKHSLNFRRNVTVSQDKYNHQVLC